MASELQSLLEKINAEGVKKAEAERAEIISEAKNEAQKIISGAKAEAERIRTEAENDSSALQQRAKSAVEQAARDIIRELKSELEARMNTAVKDAVAQALSPELMAQIVRDLATRFINNPEDELSLRCTLRDADAFNTALKNALADSLVKKPVILADGTLYGGFEAGFKNGESYDFSIDAICDITAAYVGEQIAGLFKEKQD